jgi:hypothetical protein
MDSNYFQFKISELNDRLARSKIFGGGSSPFGGFKEPPAEPPPACLFIVPWRNQGQTAIRQDFSIRSFKPQTKRR